MLLISSALLTSVAAAQDQDPEAKRAELEQRQAALSGEIDGLRASNDELVGALGTLNSQLVDQQTAVDEAAKATVETTTRLAEARIREQSARGQVTTTEQRLRELAVSAYLGPPGDTASVILLGGPIDEMPKRRVLAGVRLQQVTDAIAEMKRVRAEAERVRRQLQEAEAAARRAESDQRSRLAELSASRENHESLLEQVATRLDRALAESNQLSAADAALAAQIRAHEDELQRQLLIASTPAPPEPDEPAPGQAPPANPATPVATASTPGTTPRPTRVVQITPVDTTWVGGIEVATSLANQLAQLLEAAKASGLVLTGSGYRNIYDQITIRKQYCGTTDYDIWDRPSWECSPPVARPGRSMHEKGLAVDFTGPNGDLVRTHDSPTYQWLAANAARFGLFNLPVEPWHWSINGS
jgi:LAS superfamily LD-carboxypeptidase LdcB